MKAGAFVVPKNSGAVRTVGEQGRTAGAGCRAPHTTGEANMVDPWESRRPRQRAREDCFKTWGTNCWWCGHPNAYEVDHLQRRTDGGSPYDVANLRPSHGSNAPCPVCVSPTTGRARCCNQERNRKPKVEREAMSIDPRCI
ncbi:hypothetical protein Alo02nite_90900 [Actinoplanes lobatus]|uniref:HNH endonuclease n=1 Tax=Actinoplanes lobatus TaxID=113568 RepID=A0ABQ4AYY3_9ACTN|nr:hypothetical protein Alo02nite_90900 [Actinoplanes lobatus]